MWIKGLKHYLYPIENKATYPISDLVYIKNKALELEAENVQFQDFLRNLDSLSLDKAVFELSEAISPKIEFLRHCANGIAVFGLICRWSIELLLTRLVGEVDFIIACLKSSGDSFVFLSEWKYPYRNDSFRQFWMDLHCWALFSLNVSKQGTPEMKNEWYILIVSFIMEC